MHWNWVKFDIFRFDSFNFKSFSILYSWSIKSYIFFIVVEHSEVNLVLNPISFEWFRNFVLEVPGSIYVYGFLILQISKQCRSTQAILRRREPKTTQQLCCDVQRHCTDSLMNFDIVQYTSKRKNDFRSQVFFSKKIVLTRLMCLNSKRGFLV